MESGLYVSLSAQLSLERRMDTVARNVANMNTAGYRADAVSFSSLVSNAGEHPVSFASMGETFVDRQAGPITHTGNPLDVAIDGDGWLGIVTGNGTGYTRDGRMQLGIDGVLRTVNGNPVTDVGGTPVAVDPQGGPLTITKDGTISQGGQQVAVLGLFQLAKDATLTRAGNSGFLSDKPATAVVEFTNNGFQQGYAEGSNVNPMMEMTSLISISRAFDSANSAIQKMEDAQQKAVRDLGDV
ncbi:flagellar basal-body rod protein FlgF [Rhodobacteraceae bacterium RKSG542]|uniref:flagellar basal-body rod protein FlgF n=1 Tax=Pseudovibrio flavus TaxID=2529854 RepID=UPI0012BBF37F|nr:flagellar basal-body rod protein FlgF [Pseudovibrio flavus]MTI16943.1 flagellar basal-body rod protein FlgF [Pseudovibrio flavus]